MTLELITSEALRLGRLERLELACLILDSLAQEEKAGGAKNDASGLNKKQAKEIENRIKLFETGKMKTIPANRVQANLTKKHGLQT